MTALTSENTTFLLALVSLVAVAFSIYNYLRNPQINSDKADALMAQALKSLQDNFTQFSKDFANLKDNHLHMMDMKIDATNQAVTNLAITVTRLSTIIDERIPKK